VVANPAQTPHIRFRRTCLTESRASAALDPPTVFDMEVFIVSEGFAWPETSMHGCRPSSTARAGRYFACEKVHGAFLRAHGPQGGAIGHWGESSHPYL
jgi:hypothetical protein